MPAVSSTARITCTLSSRPQSSTAAISAAIRKLPPIVGVPRLSTWPGFSASGLRSVFDRSSWTLCALSQRMTIRPHHSASTKAVSPAIATRKVM